MGVSGQGIVGVSDQLIWESAQAVMSKMIPCSSLSMLDLRREAKERGRFLRDRSFMHFFLGPELRVVVKSAGR